MAKKVKSEVEEQQAIELAKPDFDRAIKVMLHDVKPTEEDNASSRGSLSAAWKIIEDECHVHKNAAKHFRKHILEASEDHRQDYLRSLYGLMKAANIGLATDLVDQAEGASNIVPMPTKKPSGDSGLATLDS